MHTAAFDLRTTVNIEPRWIESVVENSKGETWVFAVNDDASPLAENFRTETPIASLRGVFLKTTRFIDVALDERYADGSRETRALINLDEIASLHYFPEGQTAWITLKNGGDYSSVRMSEKQLANILRRTKLALLEDGDEETADSDFYRLPKAGVPAFADGFMRQAGGEMPGPVQSAAPERQCPRCPRRSPCASVNCGLKI